jgi:hypothetical protein
VDQIESGKEREREREREREKEREREREYMDGQVFNRQCSNTKKATTIGEGEGSKDK